MANFIERQESFENFALDVSSVLFYNDLAGSRAMWDGNRLSDPQTGDTDAIFLHFPGLYRFQLKNNYSDVGRHALQARFLEPSYSKSDKLIAWIIFAVIVAAIVVFAIVMIVFHVSHRRKIQDLESRIPVWNL